MDFTEFLELHARCVAAMRDYFVEAEESCETLEKSAAGPTVAQGTHEAVLPGDCRERGSYKVFPHKAPFYIVRRYSTNSTTWTSRLREIGC